MAKVYKIGTYNTRTSINLPALRFLLEPKRIEVSPQAGELCTVGQGAFHSP